MALFFAFIIIHLVYICSAEGFHHFWHGHFDFHSGMFRRSSPLMTIIESLSKLNNCYLQEAFRYVIYKVLRTTENGLQEVSDNSRIVENKHILAYVSGLGFGIMSGLFSMVNLLADAVSVFFPFSLPFNRSYCVCEEIVFIFIFTTFFSPFRLDQQRLDYPTEINISYWQVHCKRYV